MKAANTTPPGPLLVVFILAFDQSVQVIPAMQSRNPLSHRVGKLWVNVHTLPRLKQLASMPEGLRCRHSRREGLRRYSRPTFCTTPLRAIPFLRFPAHFFKHHFLTSFANNLA